MGFYRVLGHLGLEGFMSALETLGFRAFRA